MPGAIHALAILLAVLLLGGCSRADDAPPPLAGAHMGGHFALTNQDGRVVRDTDFNGRYRLVYFGYTFCPDVCPTDLAMIGAALRRFEASNPSRAAKVQPIFITVDPQRDTPAVLRRYVAAFHPRLIGLTGTPDQIARVARSYAVYFNREPLEPGQDPGSYLVDHSRMAVLYGPQGQPIAIMPNDQGPEGIERELEHWVR
jgi:protein SCO1/2